jgi:hypothetical protein
MLALLAMSFETRDNKQTGEEVNLQRSSGLSRGAAIVGGGLLGSLALYSFWSSRSDSNPAAVATVKSLEDNNSEPTDILLDPLWPSEREVVAPSETIEVPRQLPQITVNPNVVYASYILVQTHLGAPIAGARVVLEDSELARFFEQECFADPTRIYSLTQTTNFEGIAAFEFSADQAREFNQGWESLRENGMHTPTVPGALRVVASFDGYSTDSSAYAYIDKLTEQQEIKPHIVTLYPGLKLDAVLLDGQSGQPITGAKWAIRVQDPETQSFKFKLGETDQDGRIVAEGIQRNAVTFQLEIWSPGYEAFSRIIPSDPLPASITLSRGGTLELLLNSPIGVSDGAQVSIDELFTEMYSLATKSRAHTEVKVYSSSFSYSGIGEATRALLFKVPGHRPFAFSSEQLAIKPGETRTLTIELLPRAEVTVELRDVETNALISGATPNAGFTGPGGHGVDKPYYRPHPSFLEGTEMPNNPGYYFFSTDLFDGCDSTLTIWGFRCNGYSVFALGKDGSKYDKGLEILSPETKGEEQFTIYLRRR